MWRATLERVDLAPPSVFQIAIPGGTSRVIGRANAGPGCPQTVSRQHVELCATEKTGELKLRVVSAINPVWVMHPKTCLKLKLEPGASVTLLPRDVLYLDESSMMFSVDMPPCEDGEDASAENPEMMSDTQPATELISRPIASSSSSSGQQHQLPQQQASLKRTTRDVRSHVHPGEKEGGDGGEGEGGEGGGTAKRQRAAEGRPNPIRYADLKAVDLIGKGVCSSVFHAVWNGTDVAVKRVLRSVLQREAVKGFEAESRILFQLRHPNVIQLYGTCEHQGQLLLVTELLGRGSLRDVLDDEAVQLPWAQKLSFARDAAAGLYYLHSFDGDRAIMHRDVKSANFLVGNDWTVKVGDFGISRILSSETELRKTLCGTMSYCAPEILLGKPYTVSVDVYSFGIVMWEILTREVPFPGMTAAALREAVTKGKRPPISQAMLERYPEYCRLLVSCVVPNPDARPAMKTALNDLVEQKLQCPK